MQTIKSCEIPGFRFFKLVSFLLKELEFKLGIPPHPKQHARTPYMRVVVRRFCPESSGGSLWSSWWGLCGSMRGCSGVAIHRETPQTSLPSTFHGLLVLGLNEWHTCRNAVELFRTSVSNLLSFKIASSSAFYTRTLRFSIPTNMSGSTSIPKLSAVHSGVPARLSNEALATKEKTYSLKTLPNSVPRRSPVRLPPGVTRDAFDKAINELRKVLGKDNVELNDKALVDGWYMEHPFV